MRKGLSISEMLFASEYTIRIYVLSLDECYAVCKIMYS